MGSVILGLKVCVYEMFFLVDNIMHVKPLGLTFWKLYLPMLGSYSFASNFRIPQGPCPALVQQGLPETLLFPEPIELQGSHKSQTPTATCASQTPRDLKVALHQGVVFVGVAELWKPKSCYQRLENLVKSNLRTDMAIDLSRHFSDAGRVPLTNRVPPWCL